MYKLFFKSIFDFFAALIGLLLLSPLFILLTIGLLITNSGKPFFTQIRPGKNEKLFKILKFRTMNDKRDKDGHLLLDAQRLTKIGKFIRKTSLDEIPQLINVLKGDMSLIGPRPLLPEYLPLYSIDQRNRHLVKPGITGWAQVNGRNAISWDQKFEYDVWYVQNYSFSIDVKIIILTIKKIIKSSDISSDVHATMPRFDKRKS